MIIPHTPAIAKYGAMIVNPIVSEIIIAIVNITLTNHFIIYLFKTTKDFL